MSRKLSFLHRFEGFVTAPKESADPYMEVCRMHKDQSETSNKSTEHVVSAARRRALKVGLALSPVILTLRSKPVFGIDNCGQSMSLSAATSHGVVDVLPGCNQNTF